MKYSCHHIPGLLKAHCALEAPLKRVFPQCSPCTHLSNTMESADVAEQRLARLCRPVGTTWCSCFASGNRGGNVKTSPANYWADTKPLLKIGIITIDRVTDTVRGEKRVCDDMKSTKVVSILTQRSQQSHNHLTAEKSSYCLSLG